MQKPNFVVAFVAVVAIVGGGFALFGEKTSRSVSAVPTPTREESTLATPTPSGKKMAFAEFIKGGGAHKCTVHQYVNNTDTEGITYIADGMIRGEYNTRMEGMVMDTTLIVRDGYTYTWTSMAPNMGFKMKVAETATDVGGGASGVYAFDAKQIGDYNCEDWTLDASKFALPTGVSFTEMP